MTSFRITDTLTRQTYPATDTREVGTVLDWITSGQDITEYVESEIDAVLFMVDEGDPYVHSDILGVSVETVL